MLAQSLTTGAKLPSYNVYLDGANLNEGSKTENFRIDYAKFKSFLSQTRNIASIYYYDTTLNQLPENRFHGKLASLGYTLKLIRVKQYGVSPISQKMVDTSIVADSLWDGFHNKYDAAIFVTGDKDMLPAIRYIMMMGKTVEIMSVYNCFAWALRTSGAIVTNLSTYKNQIERVY